MKISTGDVHPTMVQPTRRNFIVWYLASLLTAFALAMIAPIIPYVIPPPAKGSGRVKIPIQLPKGLSALQDKEAISFDAPNGEAFEIASSGGDNVAGEPAFKGWLVKLGSQIKVFATNCSHLGCSVNLSSNKDRFECPCHGSQFGLNGSVLHGPATAPLAIFKWEKGTADNEIVIQGLKLG